MTHDAPPMLRKDATSNATRLLCAGVYLDHGYRDDAIRVLTSRRRLAPAYGYDGVSVLAHALAARALGRAQFIANVGGGVVIALLAAIGILDPIYVFPLLIWLVWATAFLRRLATLDALVNHLARRDGRYPQSRGLTPALVYKIENEQSATDKKIFYGGFTPFVGAGGIIRRWANAELLIGALENPADKDKDGPQKRKAIKPFNVDDITKYVAAQMLADLRDEAPPHERIETLTVERRMFAKNLGPRRATADTTADGVVHWQERDDAEREYLCVRVGSWDQELVTSVFVGFDIRGNTLHTEFYTYALLPIVDGFHLVDRLPESIDLRLMRRVAWHVVTGAAGSVASWVIGRFSVVGYRVWARVARGLRRGERMTVGGPAADDRSSAVFASEFGLERYASAVVDSGALTSIREMAMTKDFRHFFQQSDTIKYTQIVERRLLQVVETFLDDHDVDLSDHKAHQTNVQNNNNFGPGNMTVGSKGPQTFGDNSPINSGEKKEDG